MKVGVLGAGAIGAFVGAAMARAGIDVTLVARGPHLHAMQRDGVRVLSPSGDYTVPVTATDDLEVLSDAEIVLVALKSYSLPAIAARLGGLLDPGACTIWAQNGLPWWYFHRYPGELEGTVIERVDPGGIIASSISLAGVIGCVVYCSTEIVEPGVIRHVEGTRFNLGELDGARTDRGRAISKLFVTAGLKAPLDANIRDQVWLKLVGNAAFNPITALTGATLGDLGKHEEVVEVLRAVLTECAEVAAHLGRPFSRFARPPARGRNRGRSAQDVHVAGSRSGPAPRTGLHDRRHRRARRPVGDRCAAHPDRSRLRPPARFFAGFRLVAALSCPDRRPARGVGLWSAAGRAL